MLMPALRYLHVLAICFGLLVLPSCTTTVPEGQPLPDLTFEHLEPFPVQLAAVEVENRFDPASDSRDVSSSFPSAPDVALRRYAEKRLWPSGSAGTLKFVIEDAHIYHKVEESDNKYTSWMGLDRLDVFDVELRIRMYPAYDDGTEGHHAVMNLRRSIGIPQRFTVAEKEREKFNFLEKLMEDVDRAVTDALRNKMDVAG